MINSEYNIFNTGKLKLLSYPDKISDWLNESAQAPICLEIHPTERCNHHCPNCQAQFAIGNRETRQRARVGTDLDFHLLESIWTMPPQGIVISGNTGDPLLHPRLGDFLDFLAFKNIPVVLITNGQAMTRELAQKALRTCRGIRISLDAYDANSARLTHGIRSEDWDLVLKGIQILIEIRNDQSCQIGIGYLTGSKTNHGMVAATLLARELGVDYIQFRPSHFEKNDISREFSECQKLVTSYFRVLASTQKYNSQSLERNYSTCHGAYFYSIVDARADIYLCCHHVGNPKAKWGSLKDSNWSELIQEYRNSIINNFRIDKCIPLCRLHTHNEQLEFIKRTGHLPDGEILLDTVVDHKMFL